MRKYRLIFALLLLLSISFVASIYKTESSEVIGAIYIKADGSVDPPTAPISTNDNVTYTVTGNINDSIVVEKNNIVVDGSCYTVQGTRAYLSVGIDLTGRNNVTVKNVSITAFFCGIRLSWSLGNSLSGNNITANTEYGIWLRDSSNNSVGGNNTTANNHYGIRLDSSSNNSVKGNNITANDCHGIYLFYSYDNIVSENDITANTYCGIYTECSSNNNFSENNVTANMDSGIYLFSSSSSNSLSGNNVTANTHYGICLVTFSNNNSLSRNNISNTSCGVYIPYSFNNSLSENNIADTGCGMYFSHSSENNKVYHNNFNNTCQVVSVNSKNAWDDGYPSGGNYWSDYNGTDANLDGIGDTPYVFDANNTDHYPLMMPYAIPELPSFLILPLFMIATLLTVMVYRRRKVRCEAKVSGTP